MASISDITLVIKVITNSTPVNQLNSSLATLQARTNNAALANTQLGRSVGPVAGHFAGLSKTLGNAERQMDAVFRAGIHLQAMGRDLIGVGQKIAGFAKNIVETYADYDFVLRQTSLALNTNTEWHGKLDKAIQATAITLGKFSPKEVAQAYRIWGAATGDVVDSQESLARITQTVTDIMIATAMVGGSLESNLQGVYAVTQQYSLGIDKAGYVTRILALLTERTALSFGDLTQSFIYAGSYTGAIGASFEDIAQVLGVLADSGMRGTKAGRGLSMFFESIVKPSGPAKKALDAMAKSMGAVNFNKWVFPKGKFEGMRDLIWKLAGGMEKMTRVERGRFLAAAASNNAVRAMLPLLNQQLALWDKQRASGKELTNILDEYKYSLAGANDFFTQMTSSFLESFDAVIGSFSNSFFPLIQLIAMEIMKFAGPIMKQLSEKMKDLAAFLEANPELTELAVKIGAIAIVVTTLAGAFLLALGTMGFFYANMMLLSAGLVPLVTMFLWLGVTFAGLAVKFATNAGDIQGALKKLGVAIGRIFTIMLGGDDVANVFKGIAGAVNAISTGAFKALADAIRLIAEGLNKLTPEQVRMLRDIGGALLAIVLLNGGLSIAATVIQGLAVALFGFGVKGAASFGLILAVLKPFTSGIVPLVRAIGSLGGVLLAIIAPAAPFIGVLLLIAAAVAALVWAFQNNFMGFQDFVMDIIAWFQAELPGAINSALAVIEGVVEFLKTLFLTDIPAAISTAVTAIGDVVDKVLSPITSKLPAIQAFFVELGSILGDSIIPVIEYLWEVAETVFGGILRVVGEVFAGVMEHVGPLVDELAKLGSIIYDFIGPAWNFAVLLIGVVVGFIIRGVFRLVAAVMPLVQGLADFILRAFGIISEFVIRVVGAFVTFVIDRFKGFVVILQGILRIFTGLFTANWDLIWQGLADIVRGFVEMIVATIRFFFTLLESIVKLGLSVVTGIFEFIFGLAPGSILGGIGKFISEFITNIKGFIGKVVTIISEAPGKMLQIGKDIVGGIWKGIQSMIRWIVDKVRGFIRDVIPGPIKDFLGISSPSKLMARVGENIVEGLAVGITKTGDAYDAMMTQAQNIAAAATGVLGSASLELASGPLNLSSTQDATRTVNLNVDVSSADGSVNGVDLNTLAGLISGSDMVRALEHMASVD